MFTIDLPNLPPDVPAVIVAQVPDATPPSATGDRTIGVCVPVENATRPTGIHGTGLAPLMSLQSYLRNFEGREVATAAGVISVLKKPAHGAITESGEWLDYSPVAGYHGDDQVTVQVDLDGTRYELVHFLHVVDVVDDEDFDRLCPTSVWKIAYTFDPSGRLALLDAAAK